MQLYTNDWLGVEKNMLVVLSVYVSNCTIVQNSLQIKATVNSQNCRFVNERFAIDTPLRF